MVIWVAINRHLSSGLSYLSGQPGGVDTNLTIRLAGHPSHVNDFISKAGIDATEQGNLIGVALSGTLNPNMLNFADKAWDVANKPFDNGQVYTQFKPSQDFKRPGLKVRFEVPVETAPSCLKAASSRSDSRKTRWESALGIGTARSADGGSSSGRTITSRNPSNRSKCWRASKRSAGAPAGHQ